MSSKKFGSKFLKGLTSYRVAPEVTSRAIEEFYEALDCPRALAAYLLWKHNEHEQLANLSFSPLHYLTMEECRDAYCATKFLSKYRDLSLDYDLDEVALEKFEKFESLCRQTNVRFRSLEHDPKYTGRAVRLHHAVVRKISLILGEFDLNSFFSRPDWGPGASTLVKRRFASPANKFQCETGITRDLHSLIPNELLKEVYPLWAEHLLTSKFPDYQVGNRVVTVPKDATTNRVIAIEPGINLWFQKAIGNMIGRRLQRCGIDLRWQSKNQILARVGSVNDQLVTIDLSSASDSISRKVVEELLSGSDPLWLTTLEASRSHFGCLRDKTVLWEKFSSMGNGFTFQLESLIFYAVSLCCSEYVRAGSTGVSVYGDDIIIPRSALDVFTEMMGFYGFQVNLKKSHFDSPFRESCGAHYHSGVDIKPIYFKGRLDSVQAVFRLANAVRRLAHRRNASFGCDARLRAVFDHLVQSVPGPLRFRIPDGLGDGGFISNLDESSPSRMRHGIEGYLCHHVVEVSKTYQEERIGILLANLWQMETRLLSNSEVERQPTLQAIVTTQQAFQKARRNSVVLKESVKVKVTKSVVHRWCDLGPWI